MIDDALQVEPAWRAALPLTSMVTPEAAALTRAGEREARRVPPPRCSIARVWTGRFSAQPGGEGGENTCFLSRLTSREAT